VLRIIIEALILPNFLASLDFLALVVDAQREKEVPCTIDHMMNNIPRIRGIDLLASAIMPFFPVVKISSTKIKLADITGNKQIRKR
jgi:hypothetical protein